MFGLKNILQKTIKKIRKCSYKAWGHFIIPFPPDLLFPRECFYAKIQSTLTKENFS